MEFQKSVKLKKQLCFESVSDLYAKIAAQCFTADEVICFIMNMPGSGVERRKKGENFFFFREEGMPSLTQPMSVVVTVTIRKR